MVENIFILHWTYYVKLQSKDLIFLHLWRDEIRNNVRTHIDNDRKRLTTSTFDMIKLRMEKYFFFRHKSDTSAKW